MNYNEAINMAITAVLMDKNLSVTTSVGIVEALARAEELAKIGEATEFAMKDGSKNTVFSNGIDYLLEFYNEAKED